MSKHFGWFTSLLLAAAGLTTADASAADAAISKGRYLAQAGDCAACHTSAGGAAFAGGLKMLTPVGAIYSTNITPDKQTGIGDYTYDDFAQAVRGGVAKDGHQLYPAMPYTSFSRISDQDMQSLYDYFMKEVPAVNQADRDSDIPWPLNMRWPLIVWNWAFHDQQQFQADSSKSAEWNRGLT